MGGFGLALAVWLSNRGARNLVLTSKRGMRTGGQRKVVKMLQERGVKVLTHPFFHDDLRPGISATLNPENPSFRKDLEHCTIGALV